MLRPMKLIIGFLCSVACLAMNAPIVGAQAVTVDYIEGRAAQRSDDAWTALAVGDEVSLDAPVRLEELSLVQLKGQGATITLAQQGTYGLRGVLKARAALRSAGTAAAVAVAFSRIIHGTAPDSAPAGVRSEVMDIPDAPWNDLDAAGRLRSGKSYLTSGEYDAAIEELAQAAQEAPGGEASFCLATAYSLKGDPKSALAALVGVTLAGTEEWAPDYLLLRAKLLLDTFAFQRSVDVLLAAAPLLKTDPLRAQTWYFLLALAYRGTGDTASSAACLDTVQSIAPETELAISAARLREIP
jgi:tetratricopeptide (TPR) repeat protein